MESELKKIQEENRQLKTLLRENEEKYEKRLLELEALKAKELEDMKQHYEGIV